MSNDMLWTEASRDHDAELRDRRLAVARVKTSHLWPFLAAAKSKQEFTARRTLADESLRSAIAEVVGTGEEFAPLYDAVSQSYEADFDTLATERAAESVTAALKTAKDGDQATCGTCGKPITQLEYAWYHHARDFPNGEDHNAHPSPHRDSAGNPVQGSKTGVRLTKIQNTPDPLVFQGTTPDGKQVKFKVTESEAAQLVSVTHGDLAQNFSGVDVDDDDIISDTPEPGSSPGLRGDHMPGLFQGAKTADGGAFVTDMDSRTAYANYTLAMMTAGQQPLGQQEWEAAGRPAGPDDQTQSAPVQAAKTADIDNAQFIDGGTVDPAPQVVPPDPMDDINFESLTETVTSSLKALGYDEQVIEPVTLEDEGGDAVPFGEGASAPFLGAMNPLSQASDSDLLQMLQAFQSGRANDDPEGGTTLAAVQAELQQRGYDPNTGQRTGAKTAAMSRIDTLRSIVQNHQAQQIDGQLVDAQTANMLMAVYDALSPENQAKFDSVPLAKLVDLGWKHTSKTAETHGGYHLEEGDGGWYVVNHVGERKNNEPMTHDKALAYQRALMVNVPGAKEEAERHERNGDEPKHSSLAARMRECPECGHRNEFPDGKCYACGYRPQSRRNREWERKATTKTASQDYYFLVKGEHQIVGGPYPDAEEANMALSGRQDEDLRVEPMPSGDDDSDGEFWSHGSMRHIAASTYTYNGKRHCSRTNLPAEMCDCFDYEDRGPESFAIRLKQLRVPHPSEPGHAEAVEQVDRREAPWRYEGSKTAATEQDTCATCGGAIWKDASDPRAGDRWWHAYDESPSEAEPNHEAVPRGNPQGHYLGARIACKKCIAGHDPSGGTCDYCDGQGSLDLTLAMVKQADGWDQGITAEAFQHTAVEYGEGAHLDGGYDFQTAVQIAQQNLDAQRRAQQAPKGFVIHELPDGTHRVFDATEQAAGGFLPPASRPPGKQVARVDQTGAVLMGSSQGSLRTEADWAAAQQALKDSHGKRATITYNDDLGKRQIAGTVSYDGQKLAVDGRDLNPAYVIDVQPDETGPVGTEPTREPRFWDYLMHGNFPSGAHASRTAQGMDVPDYMRQMTDMNQLMETPAVQPAVPQPPQPPRPIQPAAPNNTAIPNGPVDTTPRTTRPRGGNPNAGNSTSQGFASLVTAQEEFMAPPPVHDAFEQKVTDIAADISAANPDLGAEAARAIAAEAVRRYPEMVSP